jgi:Uma2 family endonuclease
MSEIQDKKSMTINEFYRIDFKDGIIYELIDGIVRMSKPNIEHQRISGKIIRKLGEYFDNKKCEPLQEIELKLKEDILVPDISVICDDSKLTEQRYIGAPTIVVEILSPSTAHMDLFIKLYKYEVFGVNEYWIISPKGKTVTIHNFNEGNVTVYDETEIAVSEIFEGLELKLSETFL